MTGGGGVDSVLIDIGGGRRRRNEKQRDLVGE
jgi:hypothetical protein